MKHQQYQRMSDTELDRVARLQAEGYTISAIARNLGRAKSSISELIAVNKDKRSGQFRAALAVRRRAERKRRQRRPVKLATNEELLTEVYIGMVYLRRSPEQVAERLKKEYPRDMSKHISAETIYEYVYVRARGTLRDDLIASLRRPQRHRGQRRRRAVLQGRLPNLLSIDERPAGVLTRRIPGTGRVISSWAKTTGQRSFRSWSGSFAILF